MREEEEEKVTTLILIFTLPTETWIKMMMKMSPWLLLLGLVVTFTAAAGPGTYMTHIIKPY